MKASRFFVIALVSGTVVIAVPLFAVGSDWPSLLSIPLLAVIALAIATASPRYAWSSAIGVGLGFPVAILLRDIADWTKDPTSHNLFPFGLLLAALAGFIPALIGGAIGRWLGSGYHRKRWSLISVVVVALALAAACVLAMTERSEVSKKESAAIVQLRSLRDAERAYARRNNGNFTCSGAELSGSYTGSGLSAEQLTGISRKTEVSNNYRFMLNCPAGQWRIGAFPLEGQGGRTFLVDGSGEISAVRFFGYQGKFIRLQRIPD